MPSEYFIGLMSGTSVDRIDAALLDFSAGRIKLLQTHSVDIDAGLRRAIISLCQPGADEIGRMGALDRQIGTLSARLVNELLALAQCGAGDIAAIGSHGQTIRHCPPQAGGAAAFTLQIGDPNTIAELTGITTVADFRRRDLAAGGQGAPLVPRFHQAAFARAGIDRAIVNIGGMANVTVLRGTELAAGFDTGPGNVLLDAWVNHRRGARYDEDGRWAASGTICTGLLNRLLLHPFFGKPPPKSTGREDFNLDALLATLAQGEAAPPDQDIQATLLELTASSIATAIDRHAGNVQAVYLCGGGAFNRQLVRRIGAIFGDTPVHSTGRLGIAPDWVEASAFAWLARQCLRRQGGNCPPVTGARGERVLGGVYPP